MCIYIYIYIKLKQSYTKIKSLHIVKWCFGIALFVLAT